MNVPELNLRSRENQAKSTEMDREMIAKLAHALIAHSIGDGDQAAKEVSDYLKSIQTQMTKAKYELEKITRVGSSAKTNKLIGDSVRGTLDEISNAVTALQFFDRISQRMEHSANVLKMLHDSETKVNFEDEAEMRRALVRIYNGLTMDDEREIFRCVESGDDVKKTLKTAKGSLKSMLNSGGKLELF